MNHLRWIAWGVVNPDDAGTFDRMQRRNYIKRLRKELSEIDARLDCGGSTKQPWYRITLKTDDKGVSKTHSVGGVDAFRKVAQWALQELGDHVTPERVPDKVTEHAVE